MKFCMQCGHELGASRTCSSCGTIAPVEPLPAPQLPAAGIRYPLFADEVDSVSVSTSGHVLAAPVQEPLAAPPVDATAVRLPSIPVLPPRRGANPAVWLALGALVIGALVLGGWLLLHGGGSTPTAHASGSGSSAGASGSGDDVAATATAQAPVTRAPGRDTAGNLTAYDASNMLDGAASTAWEMPGDGTDKTLTFTLAKSTHLTEVGLINGYAKTGEQDGKKVDWYAGNRRVLEVEWLFDDGKSVTQDLRETPHLQKTHVDATTKTVRLRLVKVSEPGKGGASRDTTPISEVSLTGTTG
ncbi:hypothetical protein [Nocardioides sp. CER19]|uniref:NADase-type glycan-binding domain-containing protein n=1 Tax=Nocardioides sp. CER19 TaxID=3038538 RepID=UPI0024472BDC|nr:hypothetical protein [Nocardioides sp. CER19]MDH2416729.1 hypothetical protein [Nocardioides sp. CER19]